MYFRIYLLYANILGRNIFSGKEQRNNRCLKKCNFMAEFLQFKLSDAFHMLLVTNLEAYFSVACF